MYLSKLLLDNGVAKFTKTVSKVNVSHANNFGYHAKMQLKKPITENTFYWFNPYLNHFWVLTKMYIMTSFLTSSDMCDLLFLHHGRFPQDLHGVDVAGVALLDEPHFAERASADHLQRFEVVDSQPRSLQTQKLSFLDGILGSLFSLLLLWYRFFLKIIDLISLPSGCKEY